MTRPSCPRGSNYNENFLERIEGLRHAHLARCIGHSADDPCLRMDPAGELRYGDTGENTD